MADVIMKRQVTALIGRCYAGLDVADLRDEVLRRLRRIMSVDAAFFGTVDPQTLLFTSAVAEAGKMAAAPGNACAEDIISKMNQADQDRDRKLKRYTALRQVHRHKQVRPRSRHRRLDRTQPTLRRKLQ